MRNIGYQSVDLVSFKGYGYENSPLANLSGKEIRQKLDSIGMGCENCQFSYAEVHEHFDETMAFSQQMKRKNKICAPDTTKMKTIDDWKWQADQLDGLGEKTRQTGFQLGYHNHDKSLWRLTARSRMTY